MEAIFRCSRTTLRPVARGSFSSAARFAVESGLRHHPEMLRVLLVAALLAVPASSSAIPITWRLEMEAIDRTTGGPFAARIPGSSAFWIDVEFDSSFTQRGSCFSQPCANDPGARHVPFTFSSGFQGGPGVPLPSRRFTINLLRITNTQMQFFFWQSEATPHPLPRVIHMAPDVPYISLGGRNPSIDASDAISDTPPDIGDFSFIHTGVHVAFRARSWGAAGTLDCDFVFTPVLRSITVPEPALALLLGVAALLSNRRAARRTELRGLWLAPMEPRAPSPWDRSLRR